ncbi:TetR/AcrR family transcriptional regulator [Frigidibacter sp. ROC022]|uniref:TetR/AcrR family transcriptional regulator n=1 Tax=Frigidibacter sp. ROC022 TaxID=2971796 RepID=UPI00215B5D57|nr:TetR/AcrR family transcriptional regulator [Frigidibacter sp. ROC022]MCR8724272.1 TetR/AcrR family transcriptional regulator [Frigidibacter sp. ROC022]
MSETSLPTRDRLITTAARLFRSQGYNGTGMAQILAEAKAPKGSLYHHFPAGKEDLALAAADWASAGMLQIINDSFEPAATYAQGAATLCHKLARLFDLSGGRDGCPVASILLADPGNRVFRDRAAGIMGKWTRAIAYHAIRLGSDEAQAEERAENLLIAIQGAWVLGRARGSSDVLRQVPARFPG